MKTYLKRSAVILLALLMVITGCLGNVSTAAAGEKGIDIALGTFLGHIRLEGDKVAYCYNYNAALPIYTQSGDKVLGKKVTYSEGERYKGQKLDDKSESPATYKQIESFLYAAYPIDGMGFIQKHQDKENPFNAEYVTQKVLWYMLGQTREYEDILQAKFDVTTSESGEPVVKVDEAAFEKLINENDFYKSIRNELEYVCDIYEYAVREGGVAEKPELTLKNKEDFSSVDTLEFSYDLAERGFKTPVLCLTGFNGAVTVKLPEGISIYVNGKEFTKAATINTSSDTFYFYSGEKTDETIEISYIYAYSPDNIQYHYPVKPTMTEGDSGGLNKKPYQDLLSFDIVKLTGCMTVPTIYNDKTQLQIEIRKSDETTNEALAGAEFELLYRAGANDELTKLNTVPIDSGEKGVYLYEITVNTDDIKKLLDGNTVYAKEIVPPSGYMLSDRLYEVSFSDVDSKTGRIQIDITNQEIEITLVKQDAEDSTKLLSGAVFSLYRHTDNGPELVQEGLMTNENGVIRVKGLSRGVYYFKETQAPEGYLLDDRNHQFTVGTENLTFYIKNQKKQEMTALRITKIDGDTKEPLSGVVFDLYYQADGEETEKKIGTYTTDDSGLIEVEVALETLNNGRYYVKEVKTRENYILDNETKYFLVNGAVTVENWKYEKPTPNYGQLLVTKHIESGSYNDEFKFQLTITRAIPKEELEVVHSKNGIVVSSGSSVSGPALSGPAIVYTGDYGVKLNDENVITRHTDENGFFTLKAGETAIFEGIEIGSKYTVKEILDNGSAYRLIASDNTDGYIEENGAAAEFVNELITTEPTPPPTEPTTPTPPPTEPTEPTPPPTEPTTPTPPPTEPTEPTPPPTEPTTPTPPPTEPTEPTPPPTEPTTPTPPPTEPTEPTPPPTEPTEPTPPPTEPTEPTPPPTEPTTPTPPPTEPTTPTPPPTEPTTPTPPPTEPTEPTTPPTEPTEPTAPPTEPTEPVTPPTDAPEIEIPDESIPEGVPTVAEEVQNPAEETEEEIVDLEEEEIPQGTPEVTTESIEETEIEDEEIPQGAPVLPQTGTVSSGVFYLAGLMVAAAGAILLLIRGRKKTNR